MADNQNTNPFDCDVDVEIVEEQFNDIENEVEIDTNKSYNVTETSLDSIAVKLLKDNLLLTALEFHTELLESGRELPRLRDYFSNPGNFERTRDDVTSPSLRKII